MRKIIINGYTIDNPIVFRVLGDTYDRIDVDFPLRSPFKGVDILKSFNNNKEDSYIQIFEGGEPILYSNDIHIITNILGESQNITCEKISVGLSSTIKFGARPA